MEVEAFVKTLSRSREIIQKSLENSDIFLWRIVMEEAVETANEIASEHLEIVTPIRLR